MFQLQIEPCPPDTVELISEQLDNTNLLSITFSDTQDNPIFEPALGTTPLWPTVIIHALYAMYEEASAAQQMLLSSYPNLTYAIHSLPEQDWERVCLDSYHPQCFGDRLWVCPSWVTPPDSNAVNVILDPGLAFGTGTHSTTSLCLQWLNGQSLEGKTMIDYGCGSGILALACLKLGALHAYAVDIDPQALTATKNNAEVNQIDASQLSIGFPDIPMPRVDLIMANILLTPLHALQSCFYEQLNPHGMLVVSGILEEQADELITAYQSQFKQHALNKQDGWALVVFIKHETHHDFT